MAQSNPPTSSTPPGAAGTDPAGVGMGGQMGARQGSSSQAGSSGRSGATDKAREAMETARSEASDFVSRQRSRLADRVESFRQTVDETADRLEQDGSMAATPARKLSHGLDSLAHVLEAGDLEDLGRRMEDFARRNPALFIGGAMALGFLAGRFIKSSGERSADREQEAYRSDPSRYRSGFESNRAYQETGRAQASDLNGTGNLAGGSNPGA